MPAIIQKYRFYILLLLIDSLFFGQFSPNGSSFVIVPALVLLVLTVFVLLSAIMEYVAKIVTLKPKTKKRLTMITTACVTVILALQSTGQLTVRDVATLLPLVTILYFYLSYSRSRQI